MTRLHPARRLLRGAAATAAGTLLAALSIAAAPRADAAGLALHRAPDRLVVTDEGGGTAAVFTFGDREVGRPALRDLHSPAGVMITRPCPPRPGIDADDHEKIHPGVMLCFSDISGSDPWRRKTAVRFTGFTGEPAATDGGIRFTFGAEYLAEATDTPDATVVCRERSTVTIVDRTVAGVPARIITWDATLTPGDKPVTFADVEEMGFGIRLVKELSPKWGGRYLANHGGRNEAGVFGMQAAWCDASGTVDGRRAGATLVDPGGNPRQAYLHARDYGWLLANAFGRATYTRGESGAVTLRPGESLDLHYAVVLHDDVADETLPRLVAEAVPQQPTGRGR